MEKPVKITFEMTTLDGTKYFFVRNDLYELVSNNEDHYVFKEKRIGIKMEVSNTPFK